MIRPQQGQIQLSRNETQRQREFLGVLAGSPVDVSTLEEPLQTLCRHSSVHWTRRVDGEDGNTLSRDGRFDIKLKWLNKTFETLLNHQVIKYLGATTALGGLWWHEH